MTGRIFRATAALNAGQQLILPSDSPPYFTPEQVEFFEPFWDSGEPRAGEKDAQGWRAWMRRQERGGMVVISPGEVPPGAPALLQGEDRLLGPAVPPVPSVHDAWRVRGFTRASVFPFSFSRLFMKK